jgi:hypothetical protein
MSQRPIPVPLTSNGKGPFVIVWQRDAGPHDDSEPCQAEFLTSEEADQVLSWIEQDPANDGIRCSWLDTDFDLIPF